MIHHLTQEGRSILLKQRLDFGGEGGVWLTDIPDIVAKIYHNPQGDYEAKIRYMIENPPHDPMLARNHRSIAWPQEILVDEAQKFSGFLMPRISGALQLNHIYNAKLRRRSAPGFTWYYLHGVAMNLSSIIEALHAKNYVVGDLKTDNFLITDRALVSIIDTDSFQIKTPSKLFRCTVGSEGFMPPELLGVDLQWMDRTKAQDEFGLGILIHLVLLGYHPFSGEFSNKHFEGTFSREEAIAQGFSLYAKGFSKSMPPYVIEKEALHPLIYDAFVRCFEEGHSSPEKRPTALEWTKLFKQVLRELKQCGDSVQHFYVGAACSWCDRAQKTGVDLFAIGDHAKTLAIDYQLQKSLETEDLREIARLWHMHVDLHENPRFYGRRNFIQKAVDYVEALDQFKSFCEQDPSDAEILEWWSDHEALSYFPSNPHERVHNRSLHEFLQEIKERERIFAHLQQVLEGSAHTPLMGDSPINPETEAMLLKIYSSYPWQTVFREKHKAVFNRIQEAETNLSLWTVFNAAYEKKDDQKIYELWHANRLVLERFPLSKDQKSSVMEAEKSFKKMEEVRFLVKERRSLESLIDWWQKNLRFQRSTFRNQSVEGLSIESHINRAHLQLERLHQIQEALSRGDFQKASSIWDADLCVGYREFNVLLPLVQRAQETFQAWGKTKRSLLEKEAIDVVKFWDEQQFSLPAQQEGLVEEVQAQFRDVYQSVEIPETSRECLEYHKDFLHVRWVWPTFLTDEGVCLVGVSTKTGLTFSEKGSFDVLISVKKRGSIGEVLLPGSFSKDHYVYIWGGQKVCGTFLSFGKPVILKKKTPKVISYILHFPRGPFVQKSSPSASKIKITFSASCDLYVPSLILKGVANRPPVHQDKEAEIFLRIPPLSLKEKEKKKLSFLLEKEHTSLSEYRLEVDSLEEVGIDLVRQDIQKRFSLGGIS